MNIYEELNLDEFVKQLISKTKKDELIWEMVPDKQRFRLIERTVNYASIIDPFYTKNSKGEVIVVGKMDKKVYYEEDEYYYDDTYFLKFTDSTFDTGTTFTDNGKMGFQVELGKLHRIVQIRGNNLKTKIDSWFD